ncbi:MAG: hypothetical protein O2890_01580 [Cyanobacteria bacterium]|nr:hypothetical protein [Cyanobacteriota bacterium]
MDPTKDKVNTLTQKVDALHQLIDQVDARLSDILVRAQSPSEDTGVSGLYTPRGGSSRGAFMSEPSLMHKDVLIDSGYVDPVRSGADQKLSPEVQIQRLTAQLTAAYNRIAALEEQLLANRVH